MLKPNKMLKDPFCYCLNNCAQHPLFALLESMFRGFSFFHAQSNKEIILDLDARPVDKCTARRKTPGACREKLQVLHSKDEASVGEQEPLEVGLNLCGYTFTQKDMDTNINLWPYIDMCI